MGLSEELFVDNDGIPMSLLCSICLEVFDRPTRTTCNHAFCEACIRPIVKSTNTCPLCRGEVGYRDLGTARDLEEQIEELGVRCTNALSTAKDGKDNQAAIGSPSSEKKRMETRQQTAESRGQKRKGAAGVATSRCVWEGPFRMLLEHRRVCGGLRSPTFYSSSGYTTMAVELSQSTTHEALMRLSIKQLLRILADRGIKNSDCEKRDVAYQVLEIAHSSTVAVSRRDLLVRECELLSTKELVVACQRAGLDTSNCVEKPELVSLLVTYRLGGFKQQAKKAKVVAASPARPDVRVDISEPSPAAAPDTGGFCCGICKPLECTIL